MSMFNFKVKSSSENIKHFMRLYKISEDSRRGIRQAYYRMGKRTIKDIRQDILRKPRFGRIYNLKVRGRRRRHTASVSGEAPANLTGALRESTDFQVTGYHKLEVGYDNTVKYGRALELGMPERNLEPRPAIKINIDKNQSFYEKTAIQEIKKALRSRGR